MNNERGFMPLVTIVGFHHARGPEVENWFGVEDGSDPAIENEWPLLPFMALSDGSHASTEDFSYFTLRHEDPANDSAISLFGISCSRQMDANHLINRPADVTRSTVQKAVVVITDSPQAFGLIREKLSMVTAAWFAQRDFSDLDIIRRFQESLCRTIQDGNLDKDQYLGIPLREFIHDFKYQTLVLFKCCLLQPKMLFFASRCEQLCMMQFSLISLIPGLLRSLQDCADPEWDNYQRGLVRPTSLRTSDRNSLLSYMGLPLQIFGRGGLFGPYTPLQQLDVLADSETKSYIVGSTNSLLLQQRDRYSDILINLDDRTINITSNSLRSSLALSVADRRWIDFLTQTVQDTWDDANPGRPNNMGYMGSEEFIRLQFEEYLLSLISSVKYHIHLKENQKDPRSLLSDIEGDPSLEFGADWVEAWMRTENFKIFSKFTDSHLFDIVEPRHPCAGGLTIEDIQRRLAQQVSELHLDERFNTGKEVLGKHLATGQKKVSTALNSIWADIEAMREAQRKKQEERNHAGIASTATTGTASTSTSPSTSLSPNKTSSSKFPRAPDLSTAQTTLSAASNRATAYFSSWANWASEKRRGVSSSGNSNSNSNSSSGGGNNPTTNTLSRSNTSPTSSSFSPHHAKPETERRRERRSSSIKERLRESFSGTGASSFSSATTPSSFGTATAATATSMGRNVASPAAAAAAAAEKKKSRESLASVISSPNTTAAAAVAENERKVTEEEEVEMDDLTSSTTAVKRRESGKRSSGQLR
ncbi:MAG: late secretory pathway protein avl9 [Peltula sp. TS41687]|nr:MAG: late secretory pathway protein avl9 [Peltula sp. TS41687]